MINEILVYRKKDEPFKFRIITNPTLKWEIIKIDEVVLANFQVVKNCIAQDAEMAYGGKGRQIFTETRIRNKNWEEISKIEVFRECLACEDSVCPITCQNISIILNIAEYYQ